MSWTDPSLAWRWRWWKDQGQCLWSDHFRDLLHEWLLLYRRFYPIQRVRSLWTDTLTLHSGNSWILWLQFYCPESSVWEEVALILDWSSKHTRWLAPTECFPPVICLYNLRGSAWNPRNELISVFLGRCQIKRRTCVLCNWHHNLEQCLAWWMMLHSIIRLS